MEGFLMNILRPRHMKTCVISTILLVGITFYGTKLWFGDQEEVAANFVIKSEQRVEDIGQNGIDMVGTKVKPRVVELPFTKSRKNIQPNQPPDDSSPVETSPPLTTTSPKVIPLREDQKIIASTPSNPADDISQVAQSVAPVVFAPNNPSNIPNSQPNEPIAVPLSQLKPSEQSNAQVKLLTTTEKLLTTTEKQLEIINPHDFNYILNNESVCSSAQNLSYLVYFHSAPSSFVLRDILRKTWPQPNLFQNHPSRLVFFIGLPKDGKDLDQIKNESQIYGDIIMEDFLDDYKNMTYKALAAMKWIRNYCPNVKFVIKADQDVYVNIFKAVNLMDTKYSDISKSFLCGLYEHGTMPILRDPKTCLKWCVPNHILTGQTSYPKYCTGAAYIFTSDLAAMLYDVSLYTPYFYIDDAYITGLLPQKVGKSIQHFDLGFDKAFKITSGNFEDIFKSMNSSYDYFAVHDGYGNLQGPFWHRQLHHLPPEMAEMLGKEKHEALMSNSEQWRE